MTATNGRALPIFVLTGVLALLVLGSAWVLHLGPFSSSERGTLIATVDGRPIYLADASSRVKGLAVMHEDVGSAASDWQEQVLQSLIDDQIIQEEAERLGLTPSDQEIASEILRLQGMFSSLAEYEAWLTDQGIDQDELKRRIRLQSEAVAVYEAVTADATVSEGDSRAYFQEHRDEFLDASGEPQSFEDARPAIEQQLGQEKKNDAFAAWQADRRAAADVVIVVPDWWRSIQDEQQS